MPKWTDMQQKAIECSGQNIIVSAGAGSGKTAVLTQRVITKLQNKVNIQNLLILTFTNAAAMEMKTRIREALSKESELKEQLELLDSSYIMTFDAFAMAIVKKYHYVLNIPSDIGIIDKSICDTIRTNILDDIFNEYYEINDKRFTKLVNDLTIKDDTLLKKEIITLNEELDRLIDKQKYLDNYLNFYYDEKNINKLLTKFNELLCIKKTKLSKLLDNLSLEATNDYYNKLSLVINPIINSKSYDELINLMDFKFPILPRNSSDELKEIKDSLKKELDEIKKVLIYKDEKHLKDTLINTKKYASIIIDIINKLDAKLLSYKKKSNRYEFNDIAKMAITIVLNNPKIKKELTDNFKEIMVDEYQDTSDIQEKLINLISNNNLYLVGDVKQSIYRFRNANPQIFKEKYDNYSKNDGGIKIDLLHNFRSRKEVINNINEIFSHLMTENYGGADYKNAHQMNFGNMVYEEKKGKENYNFEINLYKKDNYKYSESEYEAFIIANDIKNKVNSKYQIFDKELKKLRDANYGDFCILLDRKNSFEIYKKIFEYLGLPLVIYYDEKITQEKDVLVLKNIIDLIIKIYKNEYDERFKYDFYSVMRSYLFQKTDEDYLNYYANNSFKESELYLKCLNIANNLSEYSNGYLIEKIVKEFNFYEKSILIGDIEKSIIRLDYLKDLGDSLAQMGYDVLMFNDYLQEMILNDSDISFSTNINVPNNVKLMNIHKSKGLEFSICYYAGFNKDFNRSDLNKLFCFDKEYGIILPFYDDGVGSTFVKELYKEKYNKEDISERIRLFYVALTRAKEKIIIVSPDMEDNINDESDYSSFLTFIMSIKNYFLGNINYIDNVNLTKNYNFIDKRALILEKNEAKLDVKEINIENEILESSKVSKNIKKIITNKELETLKFGTEIHQIFEYDNFYNPSNDYVKRLLSHLEIKPDSKIYKEYEFMTVIDDTSYNGIIDLMIEYVDHIKIIDYKLANIDDLAYLNQLSIYKKYIGFKTNKPITTYLYSIINDELKKIDV